MTLPSLISTNSIPGFVAMRRWRTLITVILTFCVGIAEAGNGTLSGPPLNPDRLKSDLSLVRGQSKKEGKWPRKIRYTFKVYDFKTDSFRQESRTFQLNRKPVRIIPHAVGVAEILWAICPRERLVAFNDISADPESSFIADSMRGRSIFRTKETELVIGQRPDLVFTVFYSSADFKEKLRQARIPSFDLGYFGTIESIKEQILLVGDIVGEEGNARALVRLMDARIAEMRKRLPRRSHPLRVLYYDEGGYIPGASSNFDSICRMIGVVNVGSEQGVRSWSQIDHETLLKWNPEVILVPNGSKLKEMLMTNRLLSHSRAVKSGSIYYVPGVYLRVASQYMLLSADYLAGVIYRQSR